MSKFSNTLATSYFIMIILTTCPVLTNSAYDCPGLTIGTDLGSADVVDNGILNEKWSLPNQRKVVNRDSEYFYILSSKHNILVSKYQNIITTTFFLSNI
jgi:hypothetical protein